MSASKTYIGNTAGPADAHTVEVHETVCLPGVISLDHRTELIGLLAHHVKHSPAGFAWGYAGSGPADLARCILIDHLGAAAWCPGCDGHGQQVWDNTRDRFVPHNPAAVDALTDEQRETVGGCVDCMGERTSFGPRLYQRFKFEVIARLPQDGRWEITSAEIETWLSEQTERRS